jgi:flagellar motor switch/type III secretory pathway protein FliN
MSATEPIIFLGASRRERLTQLLQQACEDWRQQWSGNSHASFEVEIADNLCRRPALPGGRQLAFATDGAAGRLLIAAVSAEMQCEVLGVAAPRTIEGTSETSNAVFAEALQALCQRVVRVKSNEAMTAALAGDNLARGWGDYGLTVTVKTGVDRVLLRLRLLPQLLLAMLPSEAAKPTDVLTSRRNAIGNESVAVQAWLGDAEVTLGELAALQIGDVILLDTSVSGTGQLTLPDGRAIAPVCLGSAAGHRAVSVVGKTGSLRR